MIQKLIQVGNSYAITIPKDFVTAVGLQPGQQVHVETDKETETVRMRTYAATKKTDNLSPDFLNWLEGFNKKYKYVLTELAKK